MEENTAEDIEAPETVTEFIRDGHHGKPLNFKTMKKEIARYAEKYEVEIPNFF